MTKRVLWYVFVLWVGMLASCGSVTTAAGDGGADQVADLDAPPSEANAENHSDGGATEVAPEVLPDAGPDASPTIPACTAARSPSSDTCPGRPACARCIGSDFAWLAAPGAPCQAGAITCVSDCQGCP